MEFVKLSDDIAKEWDSLVYQSDDGWLFSLFDWQKAITAIPEWGLEEHSFAVFQDGKMVAAMPLSIRPGGVVASTGWGMSGPVIAPGVHPGYRDKILKNIFRHVLDIGNKNEAQRIEVAISSLNKTSLTNRWGVNPLICYGFSDVSTHTRIIDLRLSEEKVYSRLSQDARYNIRSAVKSGFTVKRVMWSEWLDEYYEIHRENYVRTGVTPHPKAYFESVSHCFGNSNQAILLTALDRLGNPVAFHNCARFKNTSLYWTGCCKNKYLNSGVNYLLVWEALVDSLKNGCEWYEMGESFPNIGEGKEKGLSVFKGKFGGELHRLYKGEIILDNKEPCKDSLNNWLRASEDLIQQVLGPRFTGFLKKGLQKFRSI